MKYFTQLPQSTFTSTIGNFTVCNFFSYYEFDEKLLNKVQYEVDNKTTLTELSNKIYSDNNSMWLFLLANNTTDPFDLLSTNVSNYVSDYENHITTGLGVDPETDPTTNNIVAAGSIITEYGNTYGNPWEYSYIGNWDIDGPYTIVESTDYYSGKMVVKEQKNGNVISPNISVYDSVLVVSSGITSSIYSTDDTQYKTKNKVDTINDKKIIVQEKSGTIVTDTGNIQPVAAAAPSPTQDTGATYSITNYQFEQAKSKYIQIIPPTGLVNLTLKTFKY